MFVLVFVLGVCVLVLVGELSSCLQFVGVRVLWSLCLCCVVYVFCVRCSCCVLEFEFCLCWCSVFLFVGVCVFV